MNSGYLTMTSMDVLALASGILFWFIEEIVEQGIFLYNGHIP